MAIIDNPVPDADCAVIGGGVAGLVVARELEARGWTTTVYEADTRLGGRVRTHRFGPEAAPVAVDLGAMRIPGDHTWTLRWVSRLGLAGRLRPFHTILGDDGNLVRRPGGLVRVRDAAPVLVAEATALAGRAPHRHETALFAGWLLAAVDALAPRELRGVVRDDLPGLMAVADGVDLRGAVRGDRLDLQGAITADPALRAACSPRLQAFTDDLGTEFDAGLQRLDGGMDTLVHALAAGVRGPLLCGHPVRRIETGDDGVRLAVEGPDGRVRVREHALAVCTLPFSVLRDVPLSGIAPDKVEAIRGLEYAGATKVLVHVARPFWIDEGIRSGGSAPGGLVRQTYYPAVAGDGPSAFLASYTIAEDSEVLAALAPAERHARVHDELRALHPALRRPGLVLDTTSLAWRHHPWTRGCAARRWESDDAGRVAGARLAARPEGRLYFAGEHCTSRPAWIDSAIKSAHAVVDAVGTRAPYPGAARRLDVA